MFPEPETSSDTKGASLMDELPERLSTAEMLRAALVALLGQATVLVKMWCGWGNCRRAAFAIDCRKALWCPGEPADRRACGGRGCGCRQPWRGRCGAVGVSEANRDGFEGKLPSP